MLAAPTPAITPAERLPRRVAGAAGAVAPGSTAAGVGRMSSARAAAGSSSATSAPAAQEERSRTVAIARLLYDARAAPR